MKCVIVLMCGQHANEDVEKMILGNKCDMDDKRQVPTERGNSVSALGTLMWGYLNVYASVRHPSMCLLHKCIFVVQVSFSMNVGAQGYNFLNCCILRNG